MARPGQIVSTEEFFGTAPSSTGTFKPGAIVSTDEFFNAPAVSGKPPLNPKSPGNTMAAEDVLPTVGAIGGGMIGSAAIPFAPVVGGTVGAIEGGQFGATARNYIRALRDKGVPRTPGASLK